MIFLYIFTTILCLLLIYLICTKYNKIKQFNFKYELLSLDENKNLIFLSKYELYKFEQNVKLNDIMAGFYYAPGFKPIICNNEEEFQYWKNKLNTYDKILLFEYEEYKKYKNAINSYI